jgi:hypothetical protein
MNLEANDDDIGIILQMYSYAVTSVLVSFQSNVNTDRTLAVAQRKKAEAVTRLSCIRETSGGNPGQESAYPDDSLSCSGRIYFGQTLSY